VWGGASGHTYNFTRRPDGTTGIDVVVVREGKNLKGYPYPQLALKELLVNALVHRSYEQGERLRIDIDEKFLRLLNPGGLVPSVFQRVNTRLQEEIALGNRGIKGYRNPVIADVFYGAGAMDKEGSGDQSNVHYRALVYRRQEEADPDISLVKVSH
jgi:predicted HTH transcriptional regulator